MKTFNKEYLKGLVAMAIALVEDNECKPENEYSYEVEVKDDVLTVSFTYLTNVKEMLSGVNVDGHSWENIEIDVCERNYFKVLRSESELKVYREVSDMLEYIYNNEYKA